MGHESVLPSQAVHLRSVPSRYYIAQHRLCHAQPELAGLQGAGLFRTLWHKLAGYKFCRQAAAASLGTLFMCSPYTFLIACALLT